MIEQLQEKMGMVEDILKQIKFEEGHNLQSEDVGIVLDCGDGIARVAGLPGVLMSEMLDFGDNVFGVVFNLEAEEVVAIILERHVKVKQGMTVRRTGRILEIGVGEQLLGRVIDPLGVPMDGKGDIHFTKFRPIENAPPGVIDRKPVDTPLQTGYCMIDATVPIGHGQRELIIGDRQTGKTALAIDTIINQKGKDVICVYVAIGQKNATVSKIQKILNDYGALDYTVVVNAPASTPSAAQFYAPYSGCAIAEEFMEQGRRTLIVYDDLTKHAHAYRNISLLLQRPPGREAYPGDVFFVHSKLLERAAQLNDAKGAGSMTALPIIETQNGDISSYIPTNVISITDGQIFLSTELFNANIRPAMSPGVSVSRVGGAAQIAAMKKVSGILRITLAQFKEKEKFSLFSADLDEATTQQLLRGRVLIEVLKQKQHKPYYVIDQVIILYAATNGFFDKVPLEQMYYAIGQFLLFFQRMAKDVYHQIEAKKDLTDEIKNELNVIIPRIISDIGVIPDMKA